MTRESMADGHGVCGVPGQVVEQLGRFAAIGADRAYCQILDLDDLDHLEVIAGEVAPELEPSRAGRG
jgi:hypothetical protein